jgi:hypothetical protein
MTSAMLLEYEDNNIGEDKVCKRSKWRFKNEETPKKLTVRGLAVSCFKDAGLVPL